MTATERRRATLPPIPRPDAASDAALDERRRRLYRAAATLGLLTVPGIWLLNFTRPVPDPVVLYSNPAFMLLNVWVLWWFARPRPVAVVNWVSLALCGLVVVVRATVTPFLTGVDVTAALQDQAWLMVIVSIIAFLTLDYRRASALTVALYAVGTALPWAVMATQGGTVAGAARLGQVQLLCGVTLLTLGSLAWYRDHFQHGREELQRTQRLAATDALTGLDNRHALYPLLDALLGPPGGPDDGPGDRGCVLLLDIDHFKRINDTLGHTTGDAVLAQVAHTLRANLRGEDILGRWGGEEFLVGLPGAAATDAVLVAERLRRGVQDLHPAGGERVTVSVGVTAIIPGEPLQACVARADAALYRAKDQGRNAVQLYGAAAGPWTFPAPDHATRST